ncbi:unnamed protein product, partial [Didymodactylos carnosus]
KLSFAKKASSDLQQGRKNDSSLRQIKILEKPLEEVSSSQGQQSTTSSTKKNAVEAFVKSCPYRAEEIDRNAIIKQRDMLDCLKRISTRPDCYGVSVFTIDGQILFNCEALKNWIPALGPLCFFARHLIRNQDATDDITALRLRTKRYELLITIKNDQLLVVMQMLQGFIDNKTEHGSQIEEDCEIFLNRLHKMREKN